MSDGGIVQVKVSGTDNIKKTSPKGEQPTAVRLLRFVCPWRTKHTTTTALRSKLKWHEKCMMRYSP
jgi:hypothetical protein